MKYLFTITFEVIIIGIFFIYCPVYADQPQNDHSIHFQPVASIHGNINAYNWGCEIGSIMGVGDYKVDKYNDYYFWGPSLNVGYTKAGPKISIGYGKAFRSQEDVDLLKMLTEEPIENFGHYQLKAVIILPPKDFKRFSSDEKYIGVEFEAANLCNSGVASIGVGVLKGTETKKNMFYVNVGLGM